MVSCGRNPRVQAGAWKKHEKGVGEVKCYRPLFPCTTEEIEVKKIIRIEDEPGGRRGGVEDRCF